MIEQKDLQNLFKNLEKHETSSIVNINGFDVFVKSFDLSHKIALSTPVYRGDNYIPKSVRNCVLKKAEERSIKTSLSIDEDQFSISLHYLGSLNQINSSGFSELIHEFSEIAEKWRVRLDEHDRNDLVYVRAPQH